MKELLWQGDLVIDILPDLSCSQLHGCVTEEEFSKIGTGVQPNTDNDMIQLFYSGVKRTRRRIDLQYTLRAPALVTEEY